MEAELQEAVDDGNLQPPLFTWPINDNSACGKTMTLTSCDEHFSRPHFTSLEFYIPNHVG